MIRLVCDDQSHPSKTATIAEFVAGPEGWLYVVHRSGKAARRNRQSPQLAQIYDSKEPGVAHTRGRYHLECDLCGTNTTMHHATLGPILDTLAAHQLTSISLAALAARLSKHSQ